MGYRNDNYPDMKHEEQRHVHELQGSVKIADADDPHSHRFCTVSGEAIPCDGHGHVHEVRFRTDTFDDHYHEFCGKTGPAIMVNGRHVHYIESVTSVDDGHRHEFEAATLIENPTGKDCKHEDYDCCEHEHDDYNHRDERVRRYYRR